MNLPLIIKGAFYFDGETILVPHFTGEFSIVDCTEWQTEEYIRNAYSERNAQEFVENGCRYTHDGIDYFECESSPYNTEGLELLSDLSDLEFTNY